MEREEVRKRLVTRHRLQAFSSGYFGEDPALFSYSAENLAALREKQENPWQPRPFLSTPLSAPGDEWTDIPLKRLLRFYANPARFLLENRLGIRMEELTPPLEEREPFAVTGLDSYALRQELLEVLLKGDDPDDFLPVARGLGLLPPALHGELLFRREASEAEKFAKVVREIIPGVEPLPPLDFRLETGAFILSGRLEGIWPERMVRYRHAKMKGKDRIAAWIEHLALNAAVAEGYPNRTTLLMADESVEFRPVEDATSHLKVILDLFSEGVTMPLRFFPESAFAYAHKGEWRLDRAMNKWEKGFIGDGEGDNPYYRLCFGREDALNGEFERIARTLLEPMIRHQSPAESIMRSK
jgi:exodeoxyribonuclease V gamma subunit